MILSAATGPLGGARVQYELRRVLDAVGAATLIKPEIFIGMAEKKFDASGRCIDSQTMTLMRGQLNAFQKWILVVNQRTEPSHDGVGLQQA